MSEIRLDKNQKEAVITKMQRYFSRELDHDLEQFDAEFLLDFLSKELGPVYYNQGLYDAQAILDYKLEDIKDAIFEIEKPVPRS